jgi:phenylalanyl-tRNA synthetase beta subunit
MATPKGYIKYGARIRVIAKPNSGWQTVDHDITFSVPAGSDATDVRIAAQDKAYKRWRNCWLMETWQF